MTVRESRDARQDRALVMLLQALPDERLERVLEQLGVPAEKRALATAKVDNRRCQVCSHGYYMCRQLDEKSPDAHHDWTPDRNRAGEPIRTEVNVTP